MNLLPSVELINQREKPYNINNVSSGHLLDFRITFFQFLLVELKKLELEEKPKLQEDHTKWIWICVRHKGVVRK